MACNSCGTTFSKLSDCRCFNIGEIHKLIGGEVQRYCTSHIEGGVTDVYLAGEEASHPHLAEAMEAHGPVQEVRLSDVTKLTS